MEKLLPQTPAKRPVPKTKRGFALRLTFKWEYFVMLLPGLIILAINNYIPMFGIIIAFKNYRNYGNYFLNIIKSEWTLKNFDFLFKGSEAWTITRNTMGYNLIFIVMGLVLAVVFAILLNQLRNKRTSKFYQSSMFLPYFLSWVVVGYLAYAFLGTEHGFVNKSILEPLGLVSKTKHLQFYATPFYWPFILIFFNMWKYTGYNCVVYLAAISGIDPEFYEAATIDGATRWQQIKHITLPLLQPLMIIMTTLAIGRVFNADFGLFFQVPRNQGVLYDVTNVIDTYVYHALMNYNNVGMSSAAGLYQSIVGFVFVFTSNLIVRNIDREKAVF
jgi:putative aldouronate transport system permease protein